MYFKREYERRDLSAFNLTTVQYRNYQHEIAIYHFRSNILSVKGLRYLLQQTDSFGFIDTVIGPDTQLTLYRPDGDELPENAVEVAYLPLVLSRAKHARSHAHALGFRTTDTASPSIRQEAIIEWFCFEKPIEQSVLHSWVHCPATNSILALLEVDEVEGCRLFEKVATLEKGIGKGIMGAHSEHGDWHASLMCAKSRLPVLRLRWDGFAQAYEVESRARRKRALKAALNYYKIKYEAEFGGNKDIRESGGHGEVGGIMKTS